MGLIRDRMLMGDLLGNGRCCISASAPAAVGSDPTIKTTPGSRNRDSAFQSHHRRPLSKTRLGYDCPSCCPDNLTRTACLTKPPRPQGPNLHVLSNYTSLGVVTHANFTDRSPLSHTRSMNGGGLRKSSCSILRRAELRL